MTSSDFEATGMELSFNVILAYGFGRILDKGLD